MAFPIIILLLFLLKFENITCKPADGYFDFIIVGAGSAGCIVAERLSANPEIRVLLIEAGGDSLQFLQDVPLAAVKLQNNAEYNWNYTNEKQGNECLAMEDQRCNYPRGKGLGGSSQINAMMYVRGNPNDYDSWAAEGCTGWDYASILKYFKKSEHFTQSGQPGMIDPDSHGYNGPMFTEFPRFRTEYSQTFVQAGISLGMSHVDYNSERQLGVSYLLASTHNSRRVDTGTEFVTKIAKNRPNFYVTYNSHVTKVLFDGNTAKGVLFDKGNLTYVAYITRELILSAGSINTPQILMLSGIGPASTLNALKIPVLRDLPVGKNLQDHPALSTTFTTRFSGKAIQFLASFDPLVTAKWTTQGGTQLSIPYSMEALVFGKCEGSSKPEGVPDFELIFSPASYVTDLGLYQRRNHRMTKNFYDQVYSPLQRMANDSISAIVLLLHPKARGYVTLRDTNPFSKPLIYSNTFADPEAAKQDKKTILCGIRAAQKIFNSGPWNKYNPQLYGLRIPGCSKFVIDADAHWECVMEYLTTSMYHMSGTCRMGEKSDPTAVVTPDLKVIGIRKLRVIDVSVMRNVNSGHTAAPAMMIAEKGADMIKQEHNI
ncbi:glucose dehydrogenase [FAD, quinone]-like [Culicoides brevitarsis]|uniref:glucose dehydrogenase [FAD, quinone]-like n=1 Tax=Culicoides brevitarsis TaxID=469753 RepID=UPI00307B32CF